MVVSLRHHQRLIVRQRRELAELFGFETRNKYEIASESGGALAFAAEQQKGIAGFLFRQFLGHWRTFEIKFFSPDRAGVPDRAPSVPLVLPAAGGVRRRRPVAGRHPAPVFDPDQAVRRRGRERPDHHAGRVTVLAHVDVPVRRVASGARSRACRRSGPAC